MLMPAEGWAHALRPFPGRSTNGVNAQKKHILLHAARQRRWDAAVLIGRGRLDTVSLTPEFSCSTQPFNFCLTDTRVIEEDPAPHGCVKPLPGLPRRW